MVQNFGQKINILQCERGISLTVLAKRVGKSKQCLYRIKKSKNPHPVTIKKVAHALQVPISYFFD